MDEQEFAAYQQQGEGALEALLIPQRKTQRFRIYQLDLSAGQIIPFAFRGIKALLEAKYQQPPATAYRMVCDDALTVPTSQEAERTLQQIAEVYSDPFPNGYEGRSVAPSDVIELYNEEQRQYFYCDRAGVFSPVRFSPALVKNRVKVK